MSGWQIFLTIMALYWSDIITGPILYAKREVGHWFDIRSIKRDIGAIKEAKKAGKTTDKMVEESILHEVKSSDWVTKMRDRKEPTWLDNAIWHIKSKLWWRILEHPENLRHWLIHKYQRAKRGWSNRDTWGFHETIANIVIGGVKHLKKIKHGVPFEVPNDDEDMTKAVAKWDKILDSIVLTFQTSKRIANDNWLYQKSEKYDIKLANRWRKIHKKWLEEDPKLWGKSLHVMTKEECKTYEKGWKLFQEHFFGLND